MKDFADGGTAASPRRRSRRLSEMFSRLAEQASGPISLATIRDTLGDRSFAPLLVLFAMLNLLPLPPGASAFLGLPLVIVSAQMALGSKRAWLPRFLMNKSLSANQFRSLMARVVPWLVRLEVWIRPRYWPFWRRRGDRVIGVICLLLAIVVTLPIPLGNWLPAFSTALLGLSLSERDGILFGVGSLVAVAAVGVIVAVVGAAGALTQAAFGWFM